MECRSFSLWNRHGTASGISEWWNTEPLLSGTDTKQQVDRKNCRIYGLYLVEQTRNILWKINLWNREPWQSLRVENSAINKHGLFVGWLVGRFTSQQHASVSRGREETRNS